MDLDPDQDSSLAIENKKTIILMEDDEDLREVIGELLTALGYSVIRARDGAEALDRFREEFAAERPVAGAILDLTVGCLKGALGVASEMRKSAPHLPIFVTSGHSEHPVMSFPRDHGFTASLHKPFSYEDLRALLDAHFKHLK